MSDNEPRPLCGPVDSDQPNSINDEWDATTSGHFDDSHSLLFEQAMAQTRMAVCLTDPNLPDDPIVFCNSAFEKLTGYRSDEIIGRNCRFLQGPRTDPDQVVKIRHALVSQEVAVVELLNYRKDGQTFWNALHLGPIYNDDGSLKYFFGSQWDVTNLHLARAEERHAKALAREISHRLKNVFSVIGGIVNTTGRSMDARPVAKAINERIAALGRAYEPTLDDALLGTIEIGQAIRAVLQPYDPENNRIRFDGTVMRAEPNAVSVVGLVLHELATNATKYGALSQAGGTIHISWRYDVDSFDRSSLRVSWEERGGPPVISNSRPGSAGMEIADTLIGHSRGIIERDWDRDGLKVRILLPVES